MHRLKFNPGNLMTREGLAQGLHWLGQELLKRGGDFGSDKQA
jgi:hypothetical protein